MLSMVRQRPACCAALLAIPILASCAEAPLPQTVSFATPVALKPSEGLFTKIRYFADKAVLGKAKTVQIIPATASQNAAQTLLPPQLSLVSNAINRSVCAGLSTRFMIVMPNEPADLTVRMTITHIGKTDEDAALLSTGLGVGSAAATAVTGSPIPSVRLPIGMGALAMEAYAAGPRNEPAAVLLWARGADMITTNARVAPEGDAHTLAGRFGDDLTKLLATGADPLSDMAPDLPTLDGVNEYFGGRPKYKACEQFGRNPGLANTLGGKAGLPPSWTDDGGK